MAGRHETPVIVEFSWNPGYLAVFASSTLLGAVPLAVLAWARTTDWIGGPISALPFLILYPIGALVGTRAAHRTSNVHVGWTVVVGIAGFVAALLIGLYLIGWGFNSNY